MPVSYTHLDVYKRQDQNDDVAPLRRDGQPPAPPGGRQQGCDAGDAGPIFEKEFSENSYGFRPGRKADQAVIKALEFMNDGYDWIVDLDLSKFFDNVNQDIFCLLYTSRCV